MAGEAAAIPIPSLLLVLFLGLWLPVTGVVLGEEGQEGRRVGLLAQRLLLLGLVHDPFFPFFSPFFLQLT